MGGNSLRPSLITASRYGSSSSLASGFLVISCWSRCWCFWLRGSDSSCIRKQSASPVVSMPAARWSMDSAAISIGVMSDDLPLSLYRRDASSGVVWAERSRTNSEDNGVFLALKSVLILSSSGQ